MMELSEDFVKLLQIVVSIIGILALFLIFVQYQVTVIDDDLQKRATLLGDALLGSTCLTDIDLNGNAIKSLFLESKLNGLSSDKNCLTKIYDEGSVRITAGQTAWSFLLGTYSIGEADFAVAIKLQTGEVVSGTMKVLT